jgi:hypothetical protein
MGMERKNLTAVNSNREILSFGAITLASGSCLMTALEFLPNFLLDLLGHSLDQTVIFFLLLGWAKLLVAGVFTLVCSWSYLKLAGEEVQKKLEVWRKFKKAWILYLLLALPFNEFLYSFYREQLYVTKKLALLLPQLIFLLFCMGLWKLCLISYKKWSSDLST